MQISFDLMTKLRSEFKFYDIIKDIQENVTEPCQADRREPFRKSHELEEHLSDLDPTTCRRDRRDRVHMYEIWIAL